MSNDSEKTSDLINFIKNPNTFVDTTPKRRFDTRRILTFDESEISRIEFNIGLAQSLTAKLLKIIKVKEKYNLDISTEKKCLILLESGNNLFSASVRRIENAYECYVNNEILIKEAENEIKEEEY
jgi:hypothetical protein